MPSDGMAVAAGNYYNIVLKQNGSVWTTCENSKGELAFLGESTTIKRPFSMVRGISAAKAVSAGSYHCMLLTRDGHVLTAGWNKYDQLGGGPRRTTPNLLESYLVVR